MTYITTPQKRIRKGVFLKCETCGREFYVYPAYLRKSAKRGANVRFCSMKCYDKTGDKNPFWGKKHNKESIVKVVGHPNRPRFKLGSDNPNFIRFGEEFGFEGTTDGWWKAKLLRDLGKCEDCDFNDIRILTIHHLDRNRKNNTRKNLMLLCWNCHALRHYKEKTGMYR